MKEPREVRLPRWGVYKFHNKRAERIGLPITARTSEEALERAIEEHQIAKGDRWRISVRREA